MAHPDKLQFMVLGSEAARANVKVNIDDVFLNPSDDVKLLGLHLDHKLNFNKHVKILCQKVGHQLNAFYS